MLLIAGIMVFLMGLISEQITALNDRNGDDGHHDRRAAD